jgi:hypothetical protein
VLASSIARRQVACLGGSQPPASERMALVLKEWLPVAAALVAIAGVLVQVASIFDPTTALLTLVAAIVCWHNSPWQIADGAIGGPRWFVRV